MSPHRIFRHRALRALRPTVAHRLSPARGEAGSAYIITLLALVVLTIVGLSLSVITQSELIIGANERVEKRTFYAADSGVAHSLARALVQGDYGAREVTLDDPSARLSNVGFNVAMSPLLPISNPPCNLCQINNAGQYNSPSFSAVDFAVTSVAERRRGALSGPLASKTISSMMLVQPTQLPTDALVAFGDEEQTALLKF